MMPDEHPPVGARFHGAQPRGRHRAPRRWGGRGRAPYAAAWSWLRLRGAR